MLSKRNRKHVLCVSIELKKHSWKFGRTRKSCGNTCLWLVFPQHFLFKGSFFDQIVWVAMRSPFAPVLANLFVGHHERIWLENYKTSSILFYWRYVDDTFCPLDTEHDATLFFYYINDRHPNIRFTIEKEMDKKNLLFGCSDWQQSTSIVRRLSPVF